MYDFTSETSLEYSILSLLSLDRLAPASAEGRISYSSAWQTQRGRDSPLAEAQGPGCLGIGTGNPGPTITTTALLPFLPTTMVLTLYASSNY